MPTPRALTLSALLTIALLACSLTANATSYSAVVAFGDSLSDNGNLFAISRPAT